MLSFFIIRAFSEAFAIQKPNDNEAAFDLSFFNTSSGKVSVTYQNRGFFAMLNVTDEEGKVTSSLLRFNNKDEFRFNELNISWSGNYDSKTQLFTIMFSIYNIGFFPKKIDLGIFADCGFDDNDNSPITLLQDGRGFYVSSGDKYKYTTFIRDFGNYPNVDTLFIGDMAETTNYEPSYYPYFKNATVDSTTADSVFAFSWQNKEIKGETKLDLGFTLGTGVNFNTPPRVFDESDIHGTHSKGDSVEIRCKVVDYDTADTVTMHLQIADKEPESKEFNPTENNKIDYITKTISLEKSATHYKCWATDSRNFASNEVNGVIFTDGVPKLEIQQPEKTEYFLHERIYVNCTLNDDASVYLKYQFDNGLVFQFGELRQINGEKSQITLDTRIPLQLKYDKGHVLHIWLEDVDGGVSSVQDFSFTIKPPTAPELLSIFASDPAYTKGDTRMVVFGQVTDKDIGQTMTIYGRPGPEYPRTELGRHVVKQNNPPFAFLYDVPNEVPAGLHDLMFDVIDDTNITGKGRSVKVNVCERGTECEEPHSIPPTTPNSTSASTKQPSIITVAPTDNGSGQKKEGTGKNGKSKMPVIWILTALNVIAVIIILIMGVFWIRKKMAANNEHTAKLEEEDVEETKMDHDISVSQTADNPLNSTSVPQDDSAFISDYHEETNVEVFRFNNDEEIDYGI